MANKLPAPSPHQSVPLVTGKPLHVMFDHPNHTGFDQHDHEAAADWHRTQQAQHVKRNPTMAQFHAAQATLHDRAANGQPVKMRPAPSEAFLSGISDPHRQAFWRQHAQKTAVDNEQLKRLEPFRMTHVLAHGLEVTPNRFRERLKRSLPKDTLPSRKEQVDLQEVRRISQDADPPPPPLEPQEALHPEADAEYIKRAIARRHAERNGAAHEGDTERPDESTRAAVREVLARRGSRGGG